MNTTTEYFLGDALGSVRQLTDSSGEITLAKSYQPYGETLASAGNGASPFAFTGEQVDVGGLTYLRARYYSSGDGRFLTRDTWMGDYNRPLSLNRWNYVEGNPINFTDPTGLITQAESKRASEIVNELKTYRVYVEVDWGEWSYWYNDPVDSSRSGIRCGWSEGEWELNELKEIRKGVVDLSRAMGGLNKFIFNLGYVNVIKAELQDKDGTTSSDIARADRHIIKVNNTRHDINRWSTVHELGHSWDANFGWRLSKNFFILTAQYGKVHASVTCDPGKKLPGCNTAGYVYVDVLAYGADENMNMREDFANSVAAYVYPEYTQERIQKYQNPSAQYNYVDYREYLYYADYRTTLRWRIIDAFIRSTNASRPR